jgi:DUSAM domain-containing protein
MSVEVNWDDSRELEQQVLVRGLPLELTEPTRALLLRSASEVAIDREEAEAALRSVTTATVLLQEVGRRIRDGSHRINDALHLMYRLRDAGRLEEARQKMYDILDVEVVPLYRDIAETALENLALRGPVPRPRKHQS